MPPPPDASCEPAEAAEEQDDEPVESGEGLVGELRPQDESEGDGVVAAQQADELDDGAEAEEAELDDGVDEADRAEELEDEAQLAEELDDESEADELEADEADEDDEDDEDDDDAPVGRMGYSRPPAPQLDFGAAAKSALDEHDDQDADEDEQDDDLVDDLADDEAPPTPITRRLDEADGADEDDEDDEDDDEDPNATTLISHPSPVRRSSAPPPSQIAIEEAAPSSDRLEGFADDAGTPGFVPEDAPEESVEPAQAQDSVSIQFRDEDSSLAPVVDDVDLERDAITYLDDGEARRRKGLRRVVGGVMAAFLLATGGLVIFGASNGDAEPTAVGTEGLPPHAAPAKAAKATGAKAAADGAKTPAAVLPAAPAVASEADADEAATEVDDSDYEALSTKTLELLNDRDFDGAVAASKRLVELDPDKAFGYRCLGSALQDMGKIAEAREAYSACVTKATQGEVAECRALGGAKRR